MYMCTVLYVSIQTKITSGPTYPNLHIESYMSQEHSQSNGDTGCSVIDTQRSVPITTSSVTGEKTMTLLNNCLRFSYTELFAMFLFGRQAGG